MIVSFADRDTAEFAASGKTRRGWQGAASVALRKIDALRAAVRLEDLRVPPNNRLEALKGDREGQHSIRINDQWRICFRWTANGAADVEIVDYHKG
jgi:toxin HigB-1